MITNRVPESPSQKIRRYIARQVELTKGKAIRIMSEIQLCETFGVSRPTVRKALKSLLDEGILVIKPGIGTYVNPIKQDRIINPDNKTQTWGLIHGSGKIVHWCNFFLKFLGGLTNILGDLPVQLCFVELEYNDKKVMDEIRSLGLDGIISYNPTDTLKECYNELKDEMNILVCRYNYESPWEKEFITDFSDYGRTAAEYLNDHGHDKIIFIEQTPEFIFVKETLKGFEACLKERKVNFDKRFILWKDDYKVKLKTLIELGFEFSAIFTFAGFYRDVVEILEENNLKDVMLIVERYPAYSYSGDFKTAFLSRDSLKIGEMLGTVIRDMVLGKKVDNFSKKIPWRIEI